MSWVDYIPVVAAVKALTPTEEERGWNASAQEIYAAYDELNRRNIYHSLQTITAKEHERAADQLRRQEEAKQGRNALFLWGGVGLAAVITAFIALR